MRSLTPIVKNLLIINFLAFLATYVFGMRGLDLKDTMGLHFILASDFRPWQLLTYMFMHAGLTHIIFNMFALWMFGCTLERTWGPKKFLAFYLICGIGAGMIQELVQYVEFQISFNEQFPNVTAAEKAIIIDNSRNVLNAWTTVGASGAIYGILLGFGMTFPEDRIFIFPIPMPIKAKIFVWIYVVIELLSALGTSGDGVAHMAHLGGMLVGYIIIRYWRKQNGGYDGNWDGYEIRENAGFIGKIKTWFSGVWGSISSVFKSHKKQDNPRTSSSSKDKNADWDYNKKEKEREEEMDRILKKVSRSGYESLTNEEKRKLFDRK